MVLISSQMNQVSNGQRKYCQRKLVNNPVPHLNWVPATSLPDNVYRQQTPFRRSGVNFQVNLWWKESRVLIRLIFTDKLFQQSTYQLLPWRPGGVRFIAFGTGTRTIWASAAKQSTQKMNWQLHCTCGFLKHKASLWPFRGDSNSFFPGGVLPGPKHTKQFGLPYWEGTKKRQKAKKKTEVS